MLGTRQTQTQRNTGKEMEKRAARGEKRQTGTGREQRGNWLRTLTRLRMRHNASRVRVCDVYGVYTRKTRQFVIRRRVTEARADLVPTLFPFLLSASLSLSLPFPPFSFFPRVYFLRGSVFPSTDTASFRRDHNESCCFSEIAIVLSQRTRTVR